MAKYDLAISFAGEQRHLAKQFAERLDAAGYAIFYDKFEQAELWGQDLSLSLGEIYEREARYCLVIVSKDYVEKAWTNLERQHAITRFMNYRTDYILSLRTDDAALPGLPGTVGYLSLKEMTSEEVYGLLIRKIGQPNHENHVSRLDPRDQEIVRDIIRALYRRAIYTRMDSEISLEAMFASIESAIGEVQSLLPRIRSQDAQHVAATIIRHLDAIDRFKLRSDARMSLHLAPDDRKEIDRHKLQVVRLVLELRRAGAIPLQLPFSLQHYHFFSEEEADSPPEPSAA